MIKAKYRLTGSVVPCVIKDVPGGIITNETDPTVPQHVKNITEDDIAKWNSGTASAEIPETLYALGADYAEYFEWEDGNPNNEDRTSLFVSIVYGTRKIRKSTEGEDILGITSIDASVIGNARYKDDDTYSAVGMTGVMKVKDNGICQVGDYVVPGNDGLAIPSGNDAGYKVTARYSENLIEVLMAHDAEIISRTKAEIKALDNAIKNISVGKEVYVGEEEPTDEDIEIWIDTSEETDKVPTKMSELENDSGFITLEDIPVSPTKTSDLENDSGFITEIPEEYAKKDDIPNIEGLASEEFVNEAISNIDMPSPNVETSKIIKTASDNISTLEPNKYYVFPEMENLAVSLGGEIDNSIVQEYRFRFTSGTTATTLILPETVVGEISVEAKKIYEISIIDNLLLYQSWVVS